MRPDTCLACTFFPLPYDLKIGQRWTYLMVYEDLDLDSDAILGSGTDTLVVSVVSRHIINDKTYFMVSESNRDNRLYRVGSSRMIWQYNAEKGTEQLCWDIWRPPFHSDNGKYIRYDPDLNEVMVRGEPLPPDYIERSGPYELSEFALLGGNYSFFSMYPDSKYRPPDPKIWLESLISWGVTLLYDFSMDVFESGRFMVFAPHIGTVLYYSGSWESNFRCVLLLYEPEGTDQVGTGIKDISFGELKEQIKQRIEER